MSLCYAKQTWWFLILSLIQVVDLAHAAPTARVLNMFDKIYIFRLRTVLQNEPTVNIQKMHFEHWTVSAINRSKDICGARNCDHIFFFYFFLHSTVSTTSFLFFFALFDQHIAIYWIISIVNENIYRMCSSVCVGRICRLRSSLKWTVDRSVHWIIYLAIVIEFRWTNFVIFSVYWIYSSAWIVMEVQMQTTNSMGIKSSMKSTASRPQSFIWSSDFNKFINQLRQTHRQWENIKC